MLIPVRAIVDGMMASPFINRSPLNGLLFESERLKTFFKLNKDGTYGSVRIWSSAADITPEELAKDGFYFVKKLDHCACIFCRGIIGAWEKGDTARGEHQRHFPHCPFIQGKPVGNVQISLCEHLHPLWVQAVGVRLKITRHSSSDLYSLTQNREDTFISPFWTRDMKKKLSEAGFYSFGTNSDFVQCFRCGLGLFNWSDDMEPREIHAKYSPNCIVVKLCIDIIMPKLHTHSYLLTRNEQQKFWKGKSWIVVDDEMIDLVIKHRDIENNVMKMGGFPLNIIKNAVKKRLMGYGAPFYEVSDCLERVYDEMEKNKIEMNITQFMVDRAKRSEARRVEVRTFDEPDRLAGLIANENVAANDRFEEEYNINQRPVRSDSNVQGVEVFATINEPNASAVNKERDNQESETKEKVDIKEPKLEEVVQGVKELETKEIIHELACKVCLCEEAVIVLFPCRHLCMCSKCALSITMCPICRGCIKDIQKIIRS